MYSIRNVLLAVAVAAAGAVGGGCAQRPQTVTRPPLIVDQAMQRREFERSVAYYPNGDTVSGVNRFVVRSNLGPEDNEFSAAAFDIAASLGQTVAVPFTYLFIPPFTRAVYKGEDIPPTYTAIPPMRPPATTVKVGNLEVDRDTLEVRKAPEAIRSDDYRRYGARGPTDTDLDIRQPGPDQQKQEWE